MAVKFNYVEQRDQLFKKKPDVEMSIEFDDGEHVWLFRNGGSFLETELQRMAVELRDLTNETKKIKDIDHDQQAQQAFMDDMKSAMNRFKQAFKANVTSEDGSSDRWIEMNINNLELVGTLVAQMLASVKLAALGENKEQTNA